MHDEVDVSFSVGRVTRFYVPLLMQGFSQSLSYPLVAGIVSHGEHGVNALTAFSQGMMIMFMIGALGAGLVTTGLVFARTWYGYRSFRRLNTLMMVTLLILQCVPALPPFADWIFRGFFKLPPELVSIARWTLVAGTVMNLGFFVRNLPMVILFNRLESGKANNATLMRIALTFVLATLLPHIGLVGPWWGLAALTAGVWLETFATWAYARRYRQQLRDDCVVMGDEPQLKLTLLYEQLKFTLPLALGGFLLATSPLIVSAFVARSANAADMLAIHYVTLGVANPVSFAALKLQTVSVKFLPEYPGDHRMLAYALVAGALVGMIALLFATPWLGNWYFGSFQNVPERILPTTRLVVGIYAAIPIIHALRGRIEGIASARKNSRAVMMGQIAYTLALLATCVVMLSLGAPGWLVALTAIFIGPIATILTVYKEINA